MVYIPLWYLGDVSAVGAAEVHFEESNSEEKALVKLARFEVRRMAAPMFSVLVAVGVLLTRAFTSGPVFHFMDGPRHLRAIALHTYVIQPPGYWLFNRVGGLFTNPEHGLLWMNLCFSALGCVAFYGCARRLVRSPLAELGALLYATVFFAWFSGDIHCTYASQLLFPPLTFYLMLRYREKKSAMWLLAVGTSFSLGAGFRLSDGVFMVPLLILFALQLPRRHRIFLGLAVIVLCAAWLIPNEIALHRFGQRSTGEELRKVAMGAIVMGRVNAYTISNAMRFFLPLAFALGPSAWFIFRARGEARLQLWTWVLPGSAFFLLVYISDAPYLNCLLGGFVLLCLLGLNACKNRRLAAAVLVCSILVNVVFFLGFRPLPLSNSAYAIVDKDFGAFSFYAIRNQYYPSLRNIMGAK
jgi:hypothetical protein